MFLKIKNFKGAVGDISLPQKKSKFIVIFFNGLPLSFSFIEFSKIINKLGGIFLQPYYPGSWFSDGNFTLNSVIKSVEDWLGFIEKRKFYDQYFHKEYHLRYDYILLVGLSFGAYPIIKTKLQKIENLHQIILVNPVLSFWLQKNNRFFKESVCLLKKNIFNLYKNIYRASSRAQKEWFKLFNGNLDSNIKINIPINAKFYIGKLDPIVTVRDLKKMGILEEKIHVISKAKHGGDSLLKIPWKTIIK